MALADEMRLAQAEVYEVATLLRPLRRGEGGRDAAAAAHRPGLRQPVLRARRRRESCSPSCRRRLGPGVRVVRAPCIGRCHIGAGGRGRPSLRRPRRCGNGGAAPSTEHTASSGDARRTPTSRPTARAAATRRCSACAAAAQPRAAGRRSSTRPACAAAAAPASRPARKWQLGAGRARPAPDGGQCRRGRARHLQGPPLPRDRPAPLPRRHADRRAWSVEAADVYFYLRDEYPACREILLREIARLEAAGLLAGVDGPSAARRRRLHLRRGVGDDREHRGQARPAAPQARRCPSRSASSAGRR